MDPSEIRTYASRHTASRGSLRELRIRDFAIIEDLSIEFTQGLNAITGETGAGKSIILEALGLLLGDRAAAEAVRNGCEYAEVQGLLEGVDPEHLEAAGVDPLPEVVVRRRISYASSNRIYLNGNLTTVKSLRELGMKLADIHGQFDHQSLLDDSVQLDLLDEAGGLKTLRALCEVGFRELRESHAKLENLQAMDRDRVQREEFLRFQVREIEEVDPRPGEEGQLETDRVRMSNTEKLASLAGHAYDLLQGEEQGAIERVDLAMRQLEAMAAMDPDAAAQLESVHSVLPVLEELAVYLRHYLEGLQNDTGRLDDVMSRLERIARLKRKYGNKVEEILEHLENARDELARIEDLDHELSEAREDAQERRSSYSRACEEIHKARLSAARSVSEKVSRELHQLDMKDAKLEISVEQGAEGPFGADRVAFLITTNPGQPPKALNRIASGGELSRLMLGIKSVMGNRTPVLVFDEIDAGIGGATAASVGHRLKQLAKKHQVICVTHLPQIACFADRHIAIRKENRDGKVGIEGKIMESDERIQELARMLSGSVTEASLGHARELLTAAASDKIAGKSRPAGKGGGSKLP